jgi:hypothetical protein
LYDELNEIWNLQLQSWDKKISKKIVNYLRNNNVVFYVHNKRVYSYGELNGEWRRITLKPDFEKEILKNLE